MSAPLAPRWPRVATIEQLLPHSQLGDPGDAVLAAWQRAEAPSLTGQRIAVGVGSRGITNLAAIVAATCRALRDRGASPFVFPAMGSHGGGTPDGQLHVLEGYGITEAAVGAPVLPLIDSTHVGTTPSGVEVWFDTEALQADGVVVVNRIKPHTTFRGDLGSGLVKMLVVGAGHIDGASAFHGSWMVIDPVELLQDMAAVLVDRLPQVYGVAIVENGRHETASIEVVPGDRLVERERLLLAEARRLMPALPVEAVDVLVVEQMGKDISGAGMDPNITGRWFKSSDTWREHPVVGRLVVLGLSPGSGGNAVGVGVADFCTTRLAGQVDREVTALNAITAGNPANARLPIHFDDDETSIWAAVRSLALADADPSGLRLVRIRDTLGLDRIEVSEAVLAELRDRADIRVVSDLQPLAFEVDGSLVPLGH